MFPYLSRSQGAHGSPAAAAMRLLVAWSTLAAVAVGSRLGDEDEEARARSSALSSAFEHDPVRAPEGPVNSVLQTSPAIGARVTAHSGSRTEPGANPCPSKADFIKDSQDLMSLDSRFSQIERWAAMEGYEMTGPLKFQMEKNEFLTGDDGKECIGSKNDIDKEADELQRAREQDEGAQDKDKKPDSKDGGTKDGGKSGKGEGKEDAKDQVKKL
eukprot:TRINITY_DN4476_c0_g1_i1.p1 TRINITY_DN4476_c0_g1~~TRINITY_DN4476_c0_g1_i1.p1  ORF type:complete len:227 (+),score=47.04 TRINITY_DN4476_c0_g1_i1:41-682(+)